MESNNLHIGCSSYATPSWKAIFYPNELSKRMWFDYYSRHFNTYEFNGTFYRFPTVQNLLSWSGKVSDDFRFSVKVPKIITHVKGLKGCEQEIEEFYSISKDGFKNKLACILWQLPPSFSFNDDRLKSVLQVMNANFKNVVEFRHESWWRDEVIKKLTENDITFCNVNYPGLPTVIQQTTSIGYIRMHGNPRLFYSAYTTEEIETLYDQINQIGFKEVFVYFNNTASTAAIRNALQLKAITGRQPKN